MIIKIYGNKLINLSDLKPEDVDIKIIANALSKTCRYNGQCHRFYSVAEHSLKVYRIVKKLIDDSPVILQYALLHDAHEAYTGDIISPLSSYIGEAYQNIENYVQVFIEGIHLHRLLSEDEKRFVHDADVMVRDIEEKYLFDDSLWEIRKNLNHSNKWFLSPEDAYSQYLEVWEELKKESKNV